jgi:hypothetical protein
MAALSTPLTLPANRILTPSAIGMGLMANSRSRISEPAAGLKSQPQTRLTLSAPEAAWLCAFRPEVVSELARSAAVVVAKTRGWDGPRRSKVLALLQQPKLTKVQAKAYLEHVADPQSDQPPDAVRFAFSSVLSPLSPHELAQVFYDLSRSYQHLTRNCQQDHAELLLEAQQGVAELRRPFQDCESSLEAEAWAQVNYPSTRWDIHKSDIRALNPTLRQFEHLAGLYPEAMQELKLVQVANIEPPEVLSSVWANCGGGEMTFNLKYYKNGEALAQRIAKAEAKNWSSAVNIASVVTHEFGHHLHGFLLEDLGGPGFSEEERDILLTSWGPKYRRALTPCVEGPVGTVGGMLTLWLEHNPEAVSTYAQATGNYAERLAEGFTSLHHDPPEQQHAFTRRLGAVLERLYDPAAWMRGTNLAASANGKSPRSDADLVSNRRQNLYPLMLELGLTPAVVEDLLERAQGWQDRQVCLSILKREGLAEAVAVRREQCGRREERIRLRERQHVELPQEPEGFELLRQEAALGAPSLSSIEDVVIAAPVQGLSLESSFDR